MDRDTKYVSIMQSNIYINARYKGLLSISITDSDIHNFVGDFASDISSQPGHTADIVNAPE
jgi:hypothetical protein